jgi:prevent-host-death family protein
MSCTRWISGRPLRPFQGVSYSGYMTRKMTATEVKAKLLAVLDDVEKGEPVEITRHGRTIARIVPARGPMSLLGMHVGKVTSSAKPEELYSTGEVWEAM